MCVRSFQLCLTLCDPVDCSPLGSSVHGILQARILEWVPPPRHLPGPGVESKSLISPALAGSFHATSATRELEIEPIYKYAETIISEILN